MECRYTHKLENDPRLIQKGGHKCPVSIFAAYKYSGEIIRQPGNLTDLHLRFFGQCLCLNVFLQTDCQIILQALRRPSFVLREGLYIIAIYIRAAYLTKNNLCLPPRLQILFAVVLDLLLYAGYLTFCNHLPVCRFALLSVRYDLPCTLDTSKKNIGKKRAKFIGRKRLLQLLKAKRRFCRQNNCTVPGLCYAGAHTPALAGFHLYLYRVGTLASGCFCKIV